jgi:hypothetical protein
MIVRDETNVQKHIQCPVRLRTLRMSAAFSVQCESCLLTFPLRCSLTVKHTHGPSIIYILDADSAVHGLERYYCTKLLVLMFIASARYQHLAPANADAPRPNPVIPHLGPWLDGNSRCSPSVDDGAGLFNRHSQHSTTLLF